MRGDGPRRLPAVAGALLTLSGVRQALAAASATAAARATYQGLMLGPEVLEDGDQLGHCEGNAVFGCWLLG